MLWEKGGWHLSGEGASPLLIDGAGNSPRLGRFTRRRSRVGPVGERISSVIPAHRASVVIGTRVAESTGMAPIALLPASTTPVYRADLTTLIKAEYREMPGLSLTLPQAARL